jgi:hypothetical protein
MSKNKLQYLVLALVAAWLHSSCGMRASFFGSSDVRSVATMDSRVETVGEAPAAYDPNRDFSFIEKTFDSAVPQAVSSKMALSSSQVNDEILMTSEYSDEVIAKNQVTRPVIIDSFKQGTKGAEVTETFSQVASKSGALDILIVMDNSGSMSAEQANIATKLQDLLLNVSRADWRIAVVTTDPMDGCQRALIKKGDADATGAFSRAVRPGTSGGSNEQGILMSVVGLRGSFPAGVSGGACSATAPWLRADSAVAVLIVSDEDNCSSNGAGCGANAWSKEHYLYDHLASVRKPGVDAKVYGIIYHPSQTRQDCQTGSTQGTQYSNIIQRTGGLWGSVCASDYSAVLQRISEDAATLLKDQYILKNIPDLSSAAVRINGQITTSGWNIKDNTLTFTVVPPAGASLAITYTVGSRPIKSRFKLTGLPALETIRVTENGALLASAKYSIDATTNELVYTAPDDADVRIEYRQTTPELVSAFDLGSGVKSSSLIVTVNDAVVKNYSMSPDGKTLTFSAPPADAAKIVFNLQRFKAKRLAYVYSLPSGVVGGDYEVKNQRTAAKVPVSLASGQLKISENDHVEGDKLAVSYRILKPASGWEFPLAISPDQGTLKVLAGLRECPPSSYSVTADKLSIKCDTSGVDTIDVSYVHTGPSLAEVDVPETQGKKGVEWLISINKDTAVLGTDYELAGTKVKFLKPHPQASRVKILVKYLKD